MLGYETEGFILMSLVLASIVCVFGYFFAKRVKKRPKVRKYDVVEGLFRRLQVMTSCYVAFSHGANDVANAMGPLAVIFQSAE